MPALREPCPRLVRLCQSVSIFLRPCPEFTRSHYCRQFATTKYHGLARFSSPAVNCCQSSWVAAPIRRLSREKRPSREKRRSTNRMKMWAKERDGNPGMNMTAVSIRHPAALYNRAGPIACQACRLSCFLTLRRMWPRTMCSRHRRKTLI